MHGNNISDETAEQAKERQQYYKDAENEEIKIRLDVEALCDSWGNKENIKASKAARLITMIETLRNLKI